jgi:Zn-dependent M28 family amino/carboxypeptidase
VAAILPGRDPVLKNEYVVVGAHYDHLGKGGPGSGTRALDTVAIHYGADDNASGVAAMLDVAARAKSEKKNRRSIVFVAFGAEEMGLIGSKQFTGAPPVDLSKATAMFNFDMVGRLDTASRALSIGGTQTSAESEEMLTRLNTGFRLAFSGEGIGPSDHAPFYLRNIPVFFFSTGAHPDYHTPGDVAQKINFSGIQQITDYSWSMVREIANRENRLTFKEAGSKIQRSRGGRFKVTLGVMPDYAGLEKNGMRVDAVTPGKPAEKAGMQKGDIVTAIDGKSVGNIYDYMNRLKTLTEGQTISVDVLRNGKSVVLIVQL